MEVWLTVKQDNDYEVNNYGTIRKKSNGRIINAHLNKPDGYKRVTLNGKHEYVHRIVADTFYDGDHTGYRVTHLDGDRLNNFVGNLEWRSASDSFDRSSNEYINKKVVCCKYCSNRYKYDFCEDKHDDFYCGYGKIK